MNIEEVARAFLLEYNGYEYYDKVNLDFCNSIILSIVKDPNYDCSEVKQYLFENGYINIIGNNSVSLTPKGINYV
jgi:hypothetical protein